MKNRVVTIALAAALVLPAGLALGQQPAPSQSTPAQGLTIASDSLLGTKVFDRDGKEFGELSKLMIDARQGKITQAIIKHGGRLGMGGKEVAVPWEALQLQQGRDQGLVITMQQQFLDQVPPSQPSASPSTDQSGNKK